MNVKATTTNLVIFLHPLQLLHPQRYNTDRSTMDRMMVTTTQMNSVILLKPIRLNRKLWTTALI
jgi:hypothetical protein